MSALSVSGFRFLGVTALTLLAGAAHANPYAEQILRTRAVPGPHIQVTYAAVGSPLTDLGILAATYGSKQTPWRTGYDYRADTGSGAVPLAPVQSCDCYVPKGISLEYQMTVSNRLASLGSSVRTMTLTSTVTVGDTFDSAVFTDATSVTDARLAPDSRGIPEPLEVQGLDCTVACVNEEADASVDGPMSTVSDAHAGTDTDARMTTSEDARKLTPDLMTVSPEVAVTRLDARVFADAPVLSADAAVPVAPIADASTSEPSTAKSHSSKGCSISRSAPRSGLPLVVLVAFLAFRRRRR